MLGRVGQSSSDTGRDMSAAPDDIRVPIPDTEPSPTAAQRFRSHAPRLMGKSLSVCSRVALRTAAIVLPICLVAIGLFYLRLYQGPISLTFMVEPIQRVLNDEMPGIQFRLEDAVLQLTKGGAVELQLTNVRVTEDTGSASRASVEMSYRALRSLRIAPTRIDLLHPRVELSEPDRPTYLLGYGRDLQGRTLTMPSSPAGGPAASTTTARETEIAKTVTIVRGRIDAARRIAEIASEIRQRKGAASFLETIGLKDASLIMSDDGHQSEFQVPSLELTMRHTSRRSIMSGEGTIAANNTVFRYRFRTEDSERQDRLSVSVEFDDLVPRAVARGQRGLGVFEGIDLPIAGRGEIELSRKGDVISGTFDVSLGSGLLHLPWLGKVPIELAGGEIKAAYAGDTRRLVIEPAMLRWGANHATIKATVEPTAGPDGVTGWKFEGHGIDGKLGSEELGSPPLAITNFVTRGIVFPDLERAEISEFAVTAGPATVTMFGSIAAAGQTRLARLDGRIGAMSIDAFKTLWPKGLAPQTRQWLAGHFVSGRLKGGTFSVANQRQRGRVDPHSGEREIALDLDIERIGIEYLKGLPPLEAAQARLSLNGTTATFSVPAATIQVTQASQVAIQDGSITFTGVDQPRPLARIDARVTGPASAIIDVLAREPFTVVRSIGLDSVNLEGKIDARFAASFPIHDALTVKDLHIIEAKATILEGQARKVLGRYNISGGSLRADARDNLIEIFGEALLDGVLTRVSWRHTLGSSPKDLQPIRLRATLGNSERAQLGIVLGDLVNGDAQLELAIRAGAPGDDEEPVVRAHADLSQAEINLSDVGYIKPPGQRAELKFDLGKRRDGNVVLQNFRLDGDTIGIGGWVALGADNRPIEYLFNDFSLNTISNLTVRGVQRPDKVWEIKATGARFDASEIFRGFLNVGAHKRHDSSVPRSAGIDLDASIDTVSGVPDTSMPNATDPLLRGVRLRMSRRGNEVQEIQLTARHDNKRLLKATLQPASAGAPRMLHIDAEDAGEALRLIGVYRHMRGGDGRLELNLDGAGAAERRGILNVRKFSVMGDQVVSDVVYAADEGQPAIQQGTTSKRRVVREQIEFDRLRTAFQTGNGQVVIEDMQAVGPLLGATLRGTLDYRRGEVKLGGTYTPLSGLNRALYGVPLFGEVFTGPRGEGIVAMTFAIQGPMSNPQVIPNPLSLMAPGIFREIFQMAPNNPTITPDRSAPRRPPQPQVTESPPATGPSPAAKEAPKDAAKDAKRPRARAKAVTPEITDGWAATTDPRAKTPQRN
jgi:hypothetical protein